VILNGVRAQDCQSHRNQFIQREKALLFLSRLVPTGLSRNQ
jgi:hypothetical protein